MSDTATDTMFITPDFSAVQDTVGVGTYKVRVTDSKVDQWAGKDGKPPTTFINWIMETFDEADEKNNGRKIFHKTPINGGGAFRLRDFYKAATGEECAGQFDRGMLYGSELEITVVEQKNNPQYTEVKSVKRLN